MTELVCFLIGATAGAVIGLWMTSRPVKGDKEKEPELFPSVPTYWRKHGSRV